MYCRSSRLQALITRTENEGKPGLFELRAETSAPLRNRYVMNFKAFPCIFPTLAQRNFVKLAALSHRTQCNSFLPVNFYVGPSRRLQNPLRHSVCAGTSRRRRHFYFSLRAFSRLPSAFSQREWCF